MRLPLTILKAALFTAVVTSFTLDALSDLSEDTSTKLLRIIAEQSTAGQGIAIPGPDIHPSTVVVSSLWLLSIMSSLAATTWAMLSLEWCAFLSGGVQAEDYEEMTEKMQRKFEAVKRWKMHLVVASIPFFLHVSIFLFLAGLWLRMRSVDRKLGFIVGVPSVVIAVSYVIVTLLPLFTEAPFFTSVSEMANIFVHELKYLLRFRRFVHPPPILTWISRFLLSIFSKHCPRPGPVYRKRLRSFLRLAATILIHTLKHIYKVAGPPVYATWTVVAGILQAILPIFRPGGDPFMELNRLFIGPSGRDRGVHQRALFWLMNTPLTQYQVVEVLKAFSNLRDQGHVEEPLHRSRDRGKVEEPMERPLLKLLVLSLSSVLENGRITEDEQPVFDHCTRLLTEEMDRTFRDSKHDPMILVRDTTISKGLKEFVGIETSPISPQTSEGVYSDYWNNVVRLLWLSPSERQIRVIIARLEMDMQSMEPLLFRRVICGLHAATLTSLEANKNQSILRFPLPNFCKWTFPDDGPSGGRTVEDGTGGYYLSPDERIDLDEELLAFLRNLLTEFYKDAQPVGEKHKFPTTTSSLIVSCTKLLDSHRHGDVPLEFHNALCSFATITWRNNSVMFDSDPSAVQALIKSVKDLSADSGSNTPNRSEKIAIRLRTMTHGPKYTTSQQYTTLDTVASLYTGPVKDDPVCLSEFIHLTAAALESVLAKENQSGTSDWLLFISRVVRNIVPHSFFADRLSFEYSTANPDHRLPYLYAHAIALSRGIGETVQNSLEVLDLLSGFDQQQGIAVIEKVLDANALAVIVLRYTLPRRPRRMVKEDLETCLDAVVRALQPLQGVINRRDHDSWRTRWKAIYLLADIRNILPQALPDFKDLEKLIDEASSAVRTYIDERLQNEPAPKDWDMKKDGLSFCRLDEAVKGLAKRDEGTAGVYSWREPGGIPYLSLYPQRIRSGRAPQAARRLLERLQRQVVFLWVDLREARFDGDLAGLSMRITPPGPILAIPPQMSNHKPGNQVLFVDFRLIRGAPSICAPNDHVSRKQRPYKVPEAG